MFVLLLVTFYCNSDVHATADARGNCDPHLLRTVCLGLATNPQCSVYERAVYGLFAGRLESILAVSQRYHDHLWAHCKVNLLRRFLSMRSEDAVPQPVLRDEDIFATIDAVPELAESSRLSFVRVQRMIILGQINELVEYLGELLERADCPAGVRRFAAHALLVLSRVRAPSFNPYPHLLVPAAQAAVESYVDKVLAPLNRPAVVVAMCAQLDDEQRYNCVARFISNSITAFVGDDADKRQQRRLLYIEACEGDVSSVFPPFLVCFFLSHACGPQPEAWTRPACCARWSCRSCRPHRWL